MVNANTAVSLTMKALLGGVLTFVVTGGAVLWAVLSFTIGGMRDDVGTIRQSLDRSTDALRVTDRESITRTSEINKNLSEQIQGLRLDFVKFADRLDNVTNRFDNAVVLVTNKLDNAFNKLDSKVDSMSIRLEASNKSMDSLSNQLEKFQSQFVATSSQEIDAKRVAALVESLKQAGLDGQKIVVIPLSAVVPKSQ